MLREHAPAKVNLTLRVLGRRPDGYHELESLVAFAGYGDDLEVEPAPRFSLAVDGPFASAIEGSSTDNLVAAAVAAAQAAAPSLRVGAFRLTKRLPVAAGVGGGSADAAAAIRLLQLLDPGASEGIDWPSLALRLGADVPVCLAGRATIMTGLGERLAALPALPSLWCLLVNPGVPLATRDVFRELRAAPLGDADEAALALAASAAPPTDNAEVLLAHLAAGANHLEAPARRLCPPVADVLATLSGMPGARLARMSGSGPTCFAVFTEEGAMAEAASWLAQRRPAWWQGPSKLR